MRYEVSWTAFVEVEDDEAEEHGAGVAATLQAIGLLDDAVNRGEGATIVAVRRDDALVGRYDISHETPRLI